jgi:hypothetical protein
MSVSFVFQVSSRELELESHLDAVMDHLLEQESLDPTLGGSLASGQVEVSIDVDARNANRALRKAFEEINAAISAAGGVLVDSLGEPVQALPTPGTAPSWNRRSLTVAA